MSTEDDDLEALFDSIAATSPTSPVAAEAPAPAANPAPSSSAGGDLYAQIGQATRKLHDTLHDIGHDRVSAVSDKLKSAADSVRTIGSGATQLSGKWAQLMDGKLSVDEFKGLAADTKAYLQDVPAKISAEIDSSSVRKLTEAIRQIEVQLAQLLIANAPDDKKKGLEGTASTPAQIQTLLSNLGF